MAAFDRSNGDCRVSGELTFTTLGAELLPPSTDGSLTVDLGAVTKADSAAIAWMLACRKTASAKGGTLRFSHVPTRLQDLIRVYGLNELLE